MGLRHALYGSTTALLGSLEAELLRRYPEAQIVASVAPPFGNSLEARLDQDLEALRAARSHIVWVALGAPRQELWAAKHAGALEPALVVGVGAAFDFLAGAKPRAPLWMQQAGFEWLHRATTEPRRLSMRYMSTNTRFAIRTAIDLVRTAPKP